MSYPKRTLEVIGVPHTVRDGKIIIPRGKDTILSGDSIIIVTTQHGVKDIREFLR